MRILVTGGSGAIGAHLVDAFWRAGHGVRVMDLVPARGRRRGPPRSDCVAGNIAGPTVVARAEQAGRSFELALPETPAVVPGDADQLQRALANLLDNAVKFTPPGGTVTAGLRRVDARVELWVEDTGIGVPADDLPDVFSRFHRGRNAALYPGSGLGLAIVKAINEAHGGGVSAENTALGGRFTLRLPACRNE